MKKKLLFAMTALFLASAGLGQAWLKKIPEVIYPDARLTELYTNTWKIAYGRVREAPEGTPVSPYMDENCYADQIWIWDTCFMAFFTKYSPEVFPGIQSLENLYSPLIDGTSSPLIIHHADNPPLFAWCEHDYFRFSGDKERINRILLEKEYLQKHYTWFTEIPTGTRPHSVANTIRMKAVKSKDGITDYIWTGVASGMDNTPRGRDSGGYGGIYWVDAISQQALTAHMISKLYIEVGDREKAKEWLRECLRLRKHINEVYWDKEDGFYYDVDAKTGAFCKVKTLASYWPMLAGIATSSQAARLVEKLKDPAVFGGDFPLPTLARSDKDYNNESGDYWRGGIWLPTTYMVVKALEQYGYHDLADEIAEKTIRQQLETYHAVEPHTIWECYSPSANRPSTEHGRRARPEFCGWSALGPISLFIENVIGIRSADAATRTITWDIKRDKGRQGVRNFPLGDVPVNIVYDGNKTIHAQSEKAFILVTGYTRRMIESGMTEIEL